MKKLFFSLMLSALFFNVFADTIPTYIEGFTRSNKPDLFYGASTDEPFVTTKTGSYGFENHSGDIRHAVMVFKTDEMTEDATGTQLKVYVDPTGDQWHTVKGGLAYLYYHEGLPLDELNESATRPTWGNLIGTKGFNKDSTYTELLDSVNLGFYNNDILSSAVTAKLNECRAAGKDLYLVWVSALPEREGRTDFAWKSDTVNATKLITLDKASASMSLGGNGNIWNGAESALSFNFIGNAPYSVTYKANDTEVVLNDLMGDTLISIMPNDTTDYHIVSATDADGAMQLLSTDTFAVNVKYQSVNIGPEFAVYNNDSLDIYVDAKGQWPFNIEFNTGLSFTLDTANADSRHVNRIALRLAKTDIDGQNLSVVSFSDKYGKKVACEDIIQTASVTDGVNVSPVYDTYFRMDKTGTGGDAENVDHSAEALMYCKNANVGYRESFIQFAKSDFPTEDIEQVFLKLDYSYSYHINSDQNIVRNTRNNIYGVSTTVDIPFTADFLFNGTSYTNYIDTSSYVQDGELINPVGTNTALSYTQLYFDITDYVKDFKAGSTNHMMLMIQQDIEGYAIYQGFSTMNDTIAANHPALIFNPSVDLGETSAINDARKSIVKVFPNPANDVINFAGMQVDMLSIYDLAGKQVLTARPLSNKVDISLLKQGTYILQLQAKEEVVSQMLIVE